MATLYLDYLKEMQSYFVRKGSVRQPIAMDQLVDNSFVEHALRLLGEYREASSVGVPRLTYG